MGVIKSLVSIWLILHERLVRNKPNLSTETFTYRHFRSVKERPFVALLLHGHQLLNHVLLLWIQCGRFLWRSGGDHCGCAGRFLLVLLFHLLQSDLLLRKHTYGLKKKRGQTRLNL